ncbi:hypothetical protein MRX96_035290 [Rhipicephalus microplus]
MQLYWPNIAAHVLNRARRRPGVFSERRHLAIVGGRRDLPEWVRGERTARMHVAPRTPTLERHVSLVSGACTVGTEPRFRRVIPSAPLTRARSARLP